MHKFRMFLYHFLLAFLSLIMPFSALSLSGLYAEAQEVEHALGGEIATTPPSGFQEITELMAEIPAGARVVTDSIRHGPVEGKIAYVYESEGGFSVCMNKKCGRPVNRVARNMPVVSPNGAHAAAVVQSGSEDKRVRVMLDGARGKAYDMVYDLCFSPDSMKLAYIAKKEDTFFVYVNQDRHRVFTMVDHAQGLIFSPDSNHLAYVASSDGKSWRLVYNGEPGEAFEQIKHVTFSPDSSRLVYAGKQGERWHFIEGDDKSAGYKDIKRIRFSPGSERMVYVARGDDGAFVVEDGQKSKVFEYIPGEPVFSSNGGRLAYAVAEETWRGRVRMRLVVDDEAGPAYDRIGAYRFSPDGSQLAYMAVTGEKGRIVHDGDAHEAYESLGLPVFSPEGRHLAYYAFHDGQWHIRKDGELGPGFDDVKNPVFSPKGERMAYVSRRGKNYMVIEDGEIVGDTYELAALPTFSPDGKHLAYTAVKDGESFLVVDGQKGEERFLSFLKGSPLVFTDDNTVQGIAARAFVDGREEFWLIRAEIE